jgi:hypothetical protein
VGLVDGACDGAGFGLEAATFAAGWAWVAVAALAWVALVIALVMLEVLNCLSVVYRQGRRKLQFLLDWTTPDPKGKSR